MTPTNTALLPSAVLSAAADLIEPPNAWTQFARARDARGRAVEPLDINATCWCIVGAVQRVTQREEGAYLAPELRFVRRANRGREPGSINDNSGKPAALAALRKAAELARSEGQ